MGFRAGKKHGTTPSELDPNLLVRTLVEHGQQTAFFNGANLGDDNGHRIAAVQLLASKGFFDSYYAPPLDPVDKATRIRWNALAEELARPGRIPAELPFTRGVGNLAISKNRQ